MSEPKTTADIHESDPCLEEFIELVKKEGVDVQDVHGTYILNGTVAFASMWMDEDRNRILVDDKTDLSYMYAPDEDQNEEDNLIVPFNGTRLAGISFGPLIKCDDEMEWYGSARLRAHLSKENILEVLTAVAAANRLTLDHQDENWEENLKQHVAECLSVPMSLMICC